MDLNSIEGKLDAMSTKMAMMEKEAHQKGKTSQFESFRPEWKERVGAVEKTLGHIHHPGSASDSELVEEMETAFQRLTQSLRKIETELG